MKSEKLGTATLAVEVTNISQHGFWVFLDNQEMFLPFAEFPWFREAPVGAILKVERPQSHRLYWPDLDIDLAVKSIENPGLYPLIAK